MKFTSIVSAAAFLVACAQPVGAASNGKLATPAEAISVPAGFKVELLRASPPGEGSWVAMTIDPQGRLIISPQGKEPMLRLKLKKPQNDTQLSLL